MSWYKKDIEEAAKVEGGGNYLSESGIYDIEIIAAFVDTNDSGARTINLYVDYNGQDQTLYGAIRLDNNDGTRNFQAGLLDKLMTVANLDDLSAPEEGTLPIGKEGADRDVAVLTDLCDVSAKIHLQMEYKIYQGKMQERKVIKAFFTPEGASAEEILNETEAGKRLATIIEKGYDKNITYKDGATEENVAQWIASGRKDGVTAASGSESSSSAPRSKPKFGRK